jgi:hypothetical protein
LVIVAWAALALVAHGVPGDGTSAWTVLLFLVSLVLPIWCCVRRDAGEGPASIDLLQPGCVLACLFYFYYVIPALHVWLDLDYHSAWVDPTWPPARLFQVTFLLSLVALAAFTIGYRFDRLWVGRRSVSQRIGEPAVMWPMSATAIAVAMLAIGLPFRVYHLVAYGGPSRNILLFLSPEYLVESGVRIGGIFSFLETFFDWGALLLVLRAVVTNRHRFVSLCILGAALVLVYFESGKRSYLLPFLLYPVIWLHYLKRRINLRRGMFYFGVGFALVTLMLVMRYVAPIFATSGFTLSAVPQDIALTPVRFYLDSPELNVFDMTMLAVQDRGALLHEIGGPFWGGLRFNFAPAAYIVPRFLWPSKPTFIDLGQVFFQHAMGGREDVGFTVGIVGALYLFGGVIGVLVGMTAVGAAFRLLYDWLRPWSRDPQRVLLYGIALWMTFHFLRFGTLGFTILQFIQFQLPGVIALLLVPRVQRQRAHSGTTLSAAPSP